MVTHSTLVSDIVQYNPISIMVQPVIKIKLSKSDFLLELAGLMALAGLIVLPLFYYSELPDRIPSHLNAGGQVDSFNGKGVIFLLPVMGVMLYFGLSVLNRYPHIFNYPVKVTADNAVKLYTIATRTVRIIKVIMAVSFAFFTYRMIDIGLNGATGTGWWFVPVFVILIFGTLIIMIRKMMKLKA